MKIIIFTIFLTTAVVCISQAEPKKHSISQHVIHGKLARFRKLPWQALLIVFANDEGESAYELLSYICGGALISDEWVLTAAHCLEHGGNVAVRLGTVNMDKAIVEMQIKNYVMHPEYQAENYYQNDIALIQLPSKVNLSTPYIKAINLPTRRMATNSFEGYNASVSGFGYYDASNIISDNLRYTDLVVLSNEESSFYYDPGEVKPSNICALGSDDITRISCDGDSGGPLVTKIDGEFTIIGSVSFGSDLGCMEGFPDCYTRITCYLDWISNVTGIQIRN